MNLLLYNESTHKKLLPVAGEIWSPINMVNHIKMQIWKELCLHTLKAIA